MDTARLSFIARRLGVASPGRSSSVGSSASRLLLVKGWCQGLKLRSMLKIAETVLNHKTFKGKVMPLKKT